MQTVVATLKVQAGKQAQFEELMSKLVVPVRQEPGNRKYQLFHSVEEPESYLVYEQYVDLAALKAHSKSAHFQEYFANGIAGLLAGTPEIARFETAD